MNQVQALVAAMRMGAENLRHLALVAPGKASVYERWADHLAEDARSLALLGQTIEDAAQTVGERQP